MTDVPLRFYGPQPINGYVGETLYTVPSTAQKAFIRDLTFSNLDPVNAVHVHVSLGSITNPSKRIIDQNMPAATATFIRPMWLMDAGETLQGIQNITTAAVPSTATALATSGTDGTAYVSGFSWTPAANTMYVLCVLNGVASGTTALNPSSITGNGTWTLIGQTTSTVAAARNCGVAAYWFFSSAAGALGTTTVNFASTQHSCAFNVFAVTNVYSGAAAVSPWTASATPIVQAVTAADSTAPGSSTASKTVTLAALQTGIVFYFAGAAATAAGTTTTTAPTGFTEPTNAEYAFGDATGSICSLKGDFTYVTAPPWSSTTVGPATFSVSEGDARASVAWEMVPGGAAGVPAWVNCQVSGIEVR